MVDEDLSSFKAFKRKLQTPRKIKADLGDEGRSDQADKARAVQPVITGALGRVQA